MTQPSSEYLTEVRCRGCRRLIGIAPIDYRIYCDTICASDYPAGSNEDRDALIMAVYREEKVRLADLARRFGLTRQRLSQIRDERDLRKAS